MVRDANYDPYQDRLSPFFGLNASFEATPEMPLQRLRCGHVKRNGNPCENVAIPGTGYLGTMPVCESHGGNHGAVKSRANEIVEAARLMITRSVPSALDTLVRLSSDPTVPSNVQLAAVKDILDRAGLKPGDKVDVTVEHTVSPADKIAEKLKALRGSDEEEFEDLGEQEV